MDHFDFPISQDLGEERGDGVVYSIALKRHRYGSQTSEDPQSHLQWVSQKIRTVQAGTLEKLVEHLAPEPEIMGVSHSYRTCFLCMYRSFADTGRIVELLVKRYHSMVAAPDDSEAETKRKKVIKEEILSFLRLWFETYPQDFYNPPSYPHFESLCPLTRRSHDLQKTIDGIKDRGDKKDGKHHPYMNTDSPAPTPSPLFSMSPEDFANALTTEDARIFLRVSASQCIDYIRTPKDTTNAPTVRTCIHHFNRVSLVVMATILGGLAPDARAFVIGQWIDIAQHCREVKNFSSLKAIVCGLQSMAVFRLTKSWEKVLNSKLQQFQELSDLLSEKDNYQMSRVLLNKEGTSKYADIPTKKGYRRHPTRHSVIGVVPYLGTFLTDLTMTNSAHHDMTQEGLINFDKFRKQFQLLAELTLYQKSATNYCFDSNYNLLHWLKNSRTISPSDSYELSRQLEPEDAPVINSTNHHHPPPPPNHSHVIAVPEIPMALASPSRLRRNLRHIFHIKGSSVGDYTPLQTSSLAHTTPPQTSSPAHTTPPQTSSLAHTTPPQTSSPAHTTPPQTSSLAHTTPPQTSSPAHTTPHSPQSISTSISSQELHFLCPSKLLKTTTRSMSLSPPTVRRGGVVTNDEGFFGVESQMDEDGRVVRIAISNCSHLNYKSLRLSSADKAYVVIQQSLKKLDISGDFKEYQLFQVTQDKRLLIPQDANVFYALSSSDPNPTLLISPKT